MCLRICSACIFIFFIILKNLTPVVALDCYKCTDCMTVTDPENTEICDSCAVWKNQDDLIERGCKPEFLETLAVCFADFCNDLRGPLCQRCSDLETCEQVQCDIKTKCFVNLVDDQRGCSSDETYDENSEDFKVCEKDNCNKVPECVVCNSMDNTDCLTNTENYYQKCAKHGLYSESNCYRQEVSDSEFRLGCSSETDYPECGSETCKTCADENCNKKEFISCYSCDISTEDCRNINEDHVLFVCTEYYDECYTGYDSATRKTLRGCMDSLDLEEISPTSIKCNESKCNNEEFPTHRKCLQCENCQDSGSSDYCTNVSASGCFTLTLEDGTVHRGCDTDDRFEDCTEDDNCEVCYDRDDCNANTCYQCTNDCPSVTDITPLKCLGKTFTGCYTLQDLDSLLISRGCVDDSTSDYCHKDNCLYCKDNNCNTHEVRTEPLLCSSCSGSQCTIEYSPAEECSSVGLLTDQCVTFEVMGVTVFKGCLSGAIPEDLKPECILGNNFCQMCSSNYCNTPILNCYECSTDGDGIECLTNPLFTKSCESGETCVTYLDESGQLHRGCSSYSGESCDLGSLCEPCSSSECNDHILPENRQFCYRCSGENCITVEGVSSLKPEPCLQFHDDESCYTYVENELTVYRGCVSDEVGFCIDNEFCITCNDETGCNSRNPSVPNELVCVKCSSNALCEGVAFGSKCQKELLLGRTDSCYTQYWTDLEVEKGCLSDLSVNDPEYGNCQANNEKCHVCNESDCNRGKSICYKCNSEQDLNCAEIVDQQYLVPCQGECVSFITEEGFTVRGCIESFQEVEFDETCREKKCNNAVLPKDHLKCIQCEGSQEECLNGSDLNNKACPRHRVGDRCFTHFENATSVTRGCVSSTVNGICTGDCISCGTSGCNREKALQLNTLSCITCQNKNCEGVTKGEICTERILLGRHDYCYWYDDGQRIQKGCLSSLTAEDDDEIGHICRHDESGKCVLCESNNCNGDLNYCVACNSAENAECGGSMKNVPMEMMKTCSDRQCVSYIDENYHTVKGCATGTNFCDETQNLDCQQCTGSMCNNVLFPEGRLQCYQCSDCDQLTTSQLPVPCKTYNSDDQCFTYVIENSIHRGCLSQTSLSCDSSTYTCLSCNSTGCNDQPNELENILSCVDCHGTTNCLGTTETIACGGTVKLGNADMCYSFHKNNEILQKGCLRNAESACDKPDDCELCFCSGCNLVNILSPTIQCLECEGDECGDELSLTTENTCNDKACVSFVSQAGFVSKGCLKNFEAEAICASYGSKHEVCAEPGCNNKRYPSDRIKCYRCTNCSMPSTSPEICSKYAEDDGCYSLISREGTITDRGCLSELQSECIGPYCENCYENGCNDKISVVTTTASPEVTTPSKETTTLSSTDGNSDQTTTVSSEVTTPSKDTTTLSSTDGYSDQTTTVSSEVTTPSKDTTTLSSTDGNSDQTTTVSSEVTTPSDLMRTCIQCNETALDSTCAWGYLATAAEKCTSESDTDCFTCYKNNLILRGCSSDLAQSLCSDGTINICNSSNGCNNQNLKTQHCAICTETCDGLRASYTVQQCSGIIKYADRGCYTLRDERFTVVERGCIASLTTDTRAICNSSDERCVICYDDGCNEGSTLKVLYKLIVVAIFLIHFKGKYIF
ncbi:uncharacterized protein LOC131430138 [Malaya genurostris]|uniref:uncharacterized protein LOC131430138 n=1 Tax=Malaya genurostris TaxID=325434 RepID=UPI0026F3BC18|nr:uncharacterized protein LOC131430138 [Malaya genurostris]